MPAAAEESRRSRCSRRRGRLKPVNHRICVSVTKRSVMAGFGQETEADDNMQMLQREKGKLGNEDEIKRGRAHPGGRKWGFRQLHGSGRCGRRWSFGHFHSLGHIWASFWPIFVQFLGYDNDALGHWGHMRGAFYSGCMHAARIGGACASAAFH